MSGRVSRCGVVVAMTLTTCLGPGLAADAQDRQPESAAGRQSLEARLEALEARVKDLEQRVEGSTAGGTAPTGAAMPAAVDESPITVRVVGKDFHEGDLLTGEVGDRISLELEFSSDLKKAVRAFTGVVVLRDVFDREVLRATLTCAADLKPEQSVRWRGVLGYQQFDEKHRRLRDLGVKELAAEFVLERAIYSDGSRDVFAEPEETKSGQNKLVAADKLPTPKPKAPEVPQTPAGPGALDAAVRGAEAPVVPEVEGDDEQQ